MPSIRKVIERICEGQCSQKHFDVDQKIIQTNLVIPYASGVGRFEATESIDHVDDKFLSYCQADYALEASDFCDSSMWLQLMLETAHKTNDCQ